ncbi:GGDEF domain-containing protein [Serratia odorifera]|jgi:diguanylate cyclase (GGDEF)-like protein|uniref:diguanylate cyclase n=2 Tax=Serratia odorifera TaxID=618 RepID=D4DXI8_SEROD|nr:GGDEF domain-containing protein [Serratia odorifera]EFE97731.1 diguanylate cyclase (GGDEF) domain protein [Serratia odorifera DSM 4582]MBJ2065282.1 GGDEF domain-containing protein [Serratia odorifera]PNK92174.1 GGDEF domain-containing protein [Serratia odorifera]RII73482.1 GGDEF domain-containing protein [Serratia odorifera]VDZ52992.1 Probable diguanylate cyclase YcdT [Serratia odorifera]
MNARSYQELLTSKHRLSLFLFLLMNAASSIFTLLMPFKNTPVITLPLMGIPLFCLAAMAYTVFCPRQYVRKLHVFAAILGVLWAAHIYLKSRYCVPDSQNFLLISLFSMFFISAIALTDNFVAFCLHSVPSAITILLLDGMNNTVRIVFTSVLPIIAFSIHHLMLKRSEAFTQALVANLYDERDKLSDLSMLDPLTGLYNRRGLENKLNQLLAPTAGRHFVVLLDIDRFKAYNDNYGHTMGDQALVQVAAAIRDAVRSRDIVVRYGGEEFLVLLTNVSEAYAAQLAERVRQRVLGLQIPHRFNQLATTTVTLSAGISALDQLDVKSAIRAADAALYQAKGNGRNTIQLAENAQSAPLA